MNGSTWVQCTISDGHISQVFFLSQRSINSNDQAVRMPGKNLFACVTKDLMHGTGCTSVP